MTVHVESNIVVVNGTRLFYEVADMLEQKVPGCVRSDIIGASHFMLMEKPAAFNGAGGKFSAAL